MAVEAVKEQKVMGDALPPLGDFLSREEAAALLRLAPATIDSLRKSKRWRRGVHWFKPRGSRPLYSRSALEAWVRGDAPPAPATSLADSPRGSRLNMDVVR